MTSVSPCLYCCQDCFRIVGVKRDLMRVNEDVIVGAWYGLRLYHMLSAPDRIWFDGPGELRCGAGLSTDVYGCSCFSFGFITFSLVVVYPMHRSVIFGWMLIQEILKRC